MGVVFVLIGPSGPATTPAAFADFAGEFAGQMASGRRRGRLRGLERARRAAVLGRACRRRPLHGHPARRRAAHPARRPRREGPARRADGQQLRLPRPGLRPRRARLVRRRRRPHRHGVPRGAAELVRARGGEDRAVLVPGLPDGPRGDGRQRRRGQVDLDDRARLVDRDVDLRARHVDRPEAGGRVRGAAGGEPHRGLPLPRGAPVRGDRSVVHADGLRRRGRRARPLRPAAHRRVPEAGVGGLPPLRDAGRHAHRTVRRPRRPGHHRDEPDARRPLRRRAVAARGRHRSRGRRPRHVPRRRPDDPQLHGRGGRLRAAGRPGVAGGQAPGAGPSHADRRRAGPAGHREQPRDPHHPSPQPARHAAHPRDARSRSRSARAGSRPSRDGS